MPGIELGRLDATHDGYDADYWADLSALYRGGKAFHERIQRFLPQHDMEPGAVYQRRLSEANYRSYLGPIVDYYTAWLFSGSMHVRAKNSESGDTIDPNPWYAEFREDCGGDIDLVDFMKERFQAALVKQRSHFLAVLPDPSANAASKAEFEELGLGRATLRKVDPEDLYDWECDELGVLEWCSIHCVSARRASIANDRKSIVETWEVYDRENVTVYTLRYEEGKRPKDPKTVVQGSAPYKHGFAQVPLVTIYIPEGMWIANRIRDPQLEHFRLGTALSWNIKRTCYAMPIFMIEDSEKPPVMGAGYYVTIGVNEKFMWSAPPSDHLIAISKEVDQQRNDMFRAAHQMALGLDNNAETVGRSADSKAADNAATRVMLNAYGAIMSKVIEETFEIVSDARGDTDVFWSIEGFSGYDTATAPELIANATNATLLNVPSMTFLTEIKTKAALAVLPEASQDVKNKIRKEIEAGVSSAGDYLAMMTALPMQNGGKDETQTPAPGVGGSGP